MTARTATYTAEFAGGFTASMVIADDGSLWIEWHPHVPQFRGQRLHKFLAAYRVWRDECLADHQRRNGGGGAVVVMEV